MKGGEDLFVAMGRMRRMKEQVCSEAAETALLSARICGGGRSSMLIQ